MWVHWEHNTRFHLTLCFRQHLLSAASQKTMDSLKRAYAQFYWDTWDEEYNPVDMRYHCDLLSCLESRDLEGARKNLELDLQDFRSI